MPNTDRTVVIAIAAERHAAQDRHARARRHEVELELPLLLLPVELGAHPPQHVDPVGREDPAQHGQRLERPRRAERAIEQHERAHAEARQTPHR